MVEFNMILEMSNKDLGWKSTATFVVRVGNMYSFLLTEICVAYVKTQ